jgi:hypothetical protein
VHSEKKLHVFLKKLHIFLNKALIQHVRIGIQKNWMTRRDKKMIKNLKQQHRIHMKATFSWISSIDLKNSHKEENTKFSKLFYDNCHASYER